VRMGEFAERVLYNADQRGRWKMHYVSDRTIRPGYVAWVRWMSRSLLNN